MVINVHAGFRWIALRVLLHFLVIIPMMYLWFLVVGNGVLVIPFISFLLVAYASLIYAQLKVPLVKKVDDIFEISNFFYTGRSIIKQGDITHIDFIGRKIIFSLGKNKLVVNLLGMDIDRYSDVVEKIKKSDISKAKTGSDLHLPPNT